MSAMRRKVSLAVLLILIIALGVTFFRVIAPFLLPLFLAGMTAIVCQPLFRYFLHRTKDRIALAAALTTATIMTSILIPILTGILIAILQLYSFSARLMDDNRWLMVFLSPPTAAVSVDDFDMDLESEEAVESDNETASQEVTEVSQAESSEDSPESDGSGADELESKGNDATTEKADESVGEQEESSLKEKVKERVASAKEAGQPKVLEDAVQYVNSWLPKDLRSDARTVSHEIRLRISAMLHDLGDRSLGRAAGTTFGYLAGAAGAIISAIIGILMYVVALYYFLADGTTLLLAAEKMIPVHAKYQRQLMEQFALVVQSVVVATFLAAFAQGVATTLALWLCNFDHLFILLVLATISALIPIAGTWMVWIPCVCILFATGHWVQALFLTAYGSIFVGFLDNVVRTYVLNNDTKLHPLLAFISILGGLQVLGLWGVFIGPIVASCLHALVQIFNHELQELSKERDLIVKTAPGEG